jgi:predicted dehydrogenase
VKPLRIAVIGAGHLGTIHARKLRTMPGVELVAIVDPVESQRARLSGELGVAGHADHRQILDAVDAAVLAAPTALHHAIGLTLLQRGVHLFVEKPLAIGAAQADDLVVAARRNSAVLQVGHVERFNPAFVAARPYMRGARFIQAERFSTFAGRSTDIGVVLDLMIHDLDLVLSVNDAPLTQVDALGLALLGPHEDVAHARLTFANGCVAVLSASRVSYQAARRMQFWSAGGFVSVDFAARSAAVVRPSQAIRDRRFDAAALTTDERLSIKDHLFQDLLPLEQLPIEPADAIEAELRDFTECLRKSRAPVVDGVQGREALRAAELILDQIAAHAWNGQMPGPVGPLLRLPATVIPAPHFARRNVPIPTARKEAG